MTIDLYDRGQRLRVARQRFESAAPVVSADSGAAAQAMSAAVGKAFDALVPWLETELQGVATAR